MMPLFNGVAFSCEFGQKGTQRGGCGWWEVVLLTKVEKKGGPFLIIPTEYLGNVRLVQAPLKTGRQMCGELRHCNG